MKKLVNKKGFTLVEMLIVVAIIGVLVVIAVPSMSNSLDAAHAATDAANLRTAKSLYATLATDPDTKPADGTVFNIVDGTFVGGDKTKHFGECGLHENAYIVVSGNTVKWVTAGEGGATVDVPECGTAAATDED